MEVLKICKTRNVKTPTRGTSGSAGLDFYIPEDLNVATLAEKGRACNSFPQISYDQNNIVKSITLGQGESILIPSGIHIKLEPGYCMSFENKSGIGSKKHLVKLAHLIDEDYEGEVHINICNVGQHDQKIEAGDKIIQGVIYQVPKPAVEVVDTLAELYEGATSERGAGGFGHTGSK